VAAGARSHGGPSEMAGLSAADLALAGSIAAISARRGPRGQGDRARDQPRRQGDRVLPQAASRRASGLAPRLEFVHFACTSEDINNLAYGTLASRRATLCSSRGSSRSARPCCHGPRHADDAMMSRTHGQPPRPPRSARRSRCSCTACASPVRPSRASRSAQAERRGRNFNATSPATRTSTGPRSRGGSSSRWVSSGIPTPPRSSPTTGWPSTSMRLARCNTVLVDLCRDFWGYVSLGYFRQKVVAGECGLLDHAHKVNRSTSRMRRQSRVANALLRFMADKLPCPAGSATHGLDGPAQHRRGAGALRSGRQSVARARPLEVDASALPRPRVQLGTARGAIQTVMRRYAVPNAYEQLKALTRGSGSMPSRGPFVDGCHTRAREAAPPRPHAGHLRGSRVAACRSV